MKKLLILLLALSLLLGGCGQAPAETTASTTETVTEATTEATTEPTTEPAPVYTNPLNGQVAEEPFTGRVFAHIVSNTQDALPHVGVNQADILFEVHASSGVVRCLALFTDITQAEAIGSTRSTRLVFNDITQHFDAVLTHAGGSALVMEDAYNLGIDHFNVDSLYRKEGTLGADTAYRDTEYNRYAPNNLFGNGPGIYAYVQSEGVSVTQPESKDYCLTFAEDGTPADGESADEITITFGRKTKTTTMVYDAELGKYVYHQYGQMMTDQITGEPEAFENVVIMRADMGYNSLYSVVDFVAGGEGYFACNGKIIPILWSCADEYSPFRFTTVDGEPLDFGVGNSYIAIINYENEVVWGTGETE